MMEENRTLKDEVRSLKEQLQTKAKLTFKNNVYYIVEEDVSEEGPYCSACHDTDRKLVRLHKIQAGGYRCEVCYIKKLAAKK